MVGAKRSKIEIGYRVGHLTVEAPTDELRSRYRVWRCRCDCGGEIRLDTRTLQRGTVRDCGCETRTKPKQKDLTGRRFGRLTCLEPTKERGESGCLIWRCLCDCGNECLAESRVLLSGGKKSCGCLGRPTSQTVESEQLVKRKKSTKNTSGYTGIYRSPKSGKWVAQITIKRKNYYLGSFDRLEDAVQARERGEKKRAECE